MKAGFVATSLHKYVSRTDPSSFFAESLSLLFHIGRGFGIGVFSLLRDGRCKAENLLLTLHYDYI